MDGLERERQVSSKGTQGNNETVTKNRQEKDSFFYEFPPLAAT